MNLNIFSAKTQVKELELSVASYITRISEQEKEILDAKERIETLSAKQSEHDAAVAAMQKEHQAKLNELEVQLADTKNSANKEAAQVLSTLGVAPEAIPVQAKDTSMDVASHFNSLPNGPEKTAFYMSHKAEVLKGLGLTK